MNERLTNIWVYLAQTPLLWLTTTLVVYQLTNWLYRRAGRRPWLNPVLSAIVLIVALLTVTGTAYQVYFDGAQFVHFLLGPATVALALPLYEQRQRLKRLLVPLLGALIVGSVSAVVAAVGLARLLGVSTPSMLSLVPKSVTTPVAMGIAEKIGGVPSLTAVLVILTGIFGAVAGPAILNRIGVQESEVRGFALGLAAHGIGTARAFQLSEATGAFSGLAMGMNAWVTPLIAPLLVSLLHLG
jgi:predicted murein hydrolase (TIGR00659 family)